MREKWLVTGASGQLGGHVLRQLLGDAAEPELLGLAGGGEVVGGVAVRRVDLREAALLRACIREFRPGFVLHLGAVTAVAAAAESRAEAELINVGATAVIAEAAEECGARLIFTSTDMVFDGTSAPYREGDPVCPVNHYGRTKAAAEKAALGIEAVGRGLNADAGRPGVLVVRPPLMVGWPCTGRATTFLGQVSALREGRPLRLFTDEYRTPAGLADVARALIGLARTDLAGLLHVAGPERLSRLEMGEIVARVLGIAEPRIEGVSRLSLGSGEPRPADLSLEDGRFRGFFAGLGPRPIAEALARG